MISSKVKEFAKDVIRVEGKEDEEERKVKWDEFMVKNNLDPEAVGSSDYDDDSDDDSSDDETPSVNEQFTNLEAVIASVPDCQSEIVSPPDCEIESFVELINPDDFGRVVKEDKSKWNRFVSLVMTPWTELRLRTAKNLDKHNHDLIMRYFSCLESFFGVDRVPPDVASIFDAIFDYYKTDRSGDSGSSLQPEYSTATESLKSTFRFEALSTKQLRKMLLLTLDVINQIVSVTNVIKSKVDLDGCLIVKTQEHILCKNGCISLIDFLKRLQIFTSILKQKVIPLRFEKYQDMMAVKAAYKISFGSDLQELESTFDRNLFFDTISKVECIFVTGYESMFRIAAVVCYFLDVPEKTSGQDSDLLICVSDLCTLLVDLSSGLRSILANYDFELEKLKSELDAQRSIPPCFSRESKLKRQCDLIQDWNDRFAVHTMEVRSTLSQLQCFNSDSIEYKGIVKDLRKLDKVSQDFSLQIQNLLTTQSALIGDLNKKHDPMGISNPAQGSVENDEPATGPRNVEDLNTPESDEQLLVYESEESTAKAESNVENKDEVYVGLFREDENDQSNLAELELKCDDEMVQQLFAPVLVELNTTLVSVKSKMQAREKDAVRKVFGSLTENDNDDLDEETDPETREMAKNEDQEKKTGGEASSVVSRKRKWNKYNEEAAKENYEPYGSPCAMGGGDFMMELKSKLSTPSNLWRQMEEENLTDQPQSPDKSDEEDSDS